MPIIEKSHVDSLIRNGYTFTFGDYLSKSFNFYSDNFGKVWLSTLISGIIPFLSLITSPNIYKAYAEIDKKSDQELNVLFDFKKTGEILLWYVLMIVMNLILLSPFIIFFAINAETIQNGYIENTDQKFLLIFGYIISWFLLFILSVVITAGLFFVIPLILFGDYNTIDAIIVSFKLVKKNFFIIAAFLFVSSLLSGLGVLLCYVGVLFTMPLFACTKYQAYKHILFSHDQSDEIETIGESYNN